LKGKQPWVAYSNRLPDKIVPMARHFNTITPETTEFLEKDKWENPLLLFARQMANDAKIVGKPQVKKHFRVMKPKDLDREFDGSVKPFKVIK
jgi:hypothetical protein